MASFFISYSRHDAAVANKIRNHIARLDASYDVFLDVSSIKVGANWKLELRKKVLAADYFILIHSPASLRSKYVAEELEWVSQAELKTGTRKLMVYRLNYADIIPQLAAYQILDATDNFTIDFFKLMQGVFSEPSFFSVEYDISLLDAYWYKGSIWIEAPKKFLSKIQMAEYRFDYGWNSDSNKTVTASPRHINNKFAVRFETKYHFTIFVMLYLWNTKELAFVKHIPINH